MSFFPAPQPAQESSAFAKLASTQPLGTLGGPQSQPQQQQQQPSLLGGGFGAQVNTQQQQPSLLSGGFGGLANTQQQQQQQQNQQQPSLLGGFGVQANTQQQQQQPSLLGGFGVQANAQQQQQQPSLLGGFGAQANTQPAQNQPSLLGGFGAQANAQPTQNPLGAFGTSKAPTNPVSGGAGTGFLGFGQPAKPQAQQAQNNPAANQPFGLSLLAPQQAQQQAQQPQQQAQNQNEQPQEAGPQPSAGLVKPGQPAYFENLLEKGKKRARAVNGESPFGELPTLQLGLEDIARRARELGGIPSQEKGHPTDGKAHYLLAASGVSPATTRRNLHDFSSQSLAPNTQPPIAGWDPDTNRYVAQLQQRSTTRLIAEGLERAHRNFDLFLEENIDIDLEEQRRKIFEHFGLASKEIDESIDSTNPASLGGRGSFGKTPRKGRGTNANDAGKTTLNRSVFGNSGLQKSVIGTTGLKDSKASPFVDTAEKNGATPKVADSRIVPAKQAKFADAVQRLNRERLRESIYPVLHEFSNVESQPGDETPSQIIDAYQAVIEMVEELPTGAEGSQLVKEREFANHYLSETPNSAEAIAVRRRIISGSRRCLEKQFFAQLETLVSRNPREANLGGIPTTINKIRAYIRIRVTRKDLAPDGVELQSLGDDPCWALIFFCLRSGFLTEAVEYVTRNATQFRALDRNFITYITSYANSPERRLSRSMQDRINVEYQQRSRIAPENSLDPYRMACYKIIGRCEISKRSIEGIRQGSEDWIWLQFSLAREVNRAEEVAGDVYGLDDVRETIREIGQRYFTKGAEGASGYGVYFFLQILGGMFEQAVSYLYPYSYTAAVHFAIALDFYGLLRVSDFTVSGDELLTYNTKGLPQVNFGRMLGYYTRDFRSGHVEAAVDYLTLICLDADLPGALGKSQADLCHEALRELILETREFAQLLGDIQPDGTRIRGLIEERLRLLHITDQDDFLRTITIQAASVANDNGRTTDAVLLYHLAEDYDNVIMIINNALSEAIAVEIGDEEMRLQPLKPRAAAASSSSPSSQAGLNGQQPPSSASVPQSSLSLTAVDNPAALARNMISLYNSNALYYQRIRPAHRDACGILLRLSEVKAKVSAGHWAEALDMIDTLHLLPLHAHSSIPTIRASAQSFNALPLPISRNIGPLLLWTITCIGQQRQILSSRPFGGSTRMAMSEELLTAAKDLMVFAGLVKYRLGERVWEAVTRCGGDVGAY